MKVMILIPLGARDHRLDAIVAMFLQSSVRANMEWLTQRYSNETPLPLALELDRRRILNLTESSSRGPQTQNPGVVFA